MQRVALLIAAALALLAGAACGRKHTKARTARQPGIKNQPAARIGMVEEGMASWYGIPYHGRPAADGEIYDMEKLVAAHRTLPFNTWLEVTNLDNSRVVKVRVIDRGPFARGRVIDLSKAAAREIQMLGPGTAHVRFKVIAAPVDIPSQDFYSVQVGAFTNRNNAERLRARFAERAGYAQLAIKQGNVPIYRVLVGRKPTQAEAEQLAGELRSEVTSVFVVRLDSSAAVPPGTDPNSPASNSTAP
jgi:rare lipoprotein A